MKHLLTATLILSLVHAGCSPVWAQTVEVPDTLPAVESGGPTAAELAAIPPSTDLAMLYHVPAAGDADITPAIPAASPLDIQAATGSDTHIGVDTAAINAKPWPTWAKVTVIVGGAAVVALTSWAIVEACQHGEHTSGDDSSTHYNIGVGGEGNTLHIRIDSPDTSRAGGY